MCCPICLLDHNDDAKFKTKCGHEYGIECLFEFVNIIVVAPKCPYCRATLDRKDIVEKALEYNSDLKHKLVMSTTELSKLRGITMTRNLLFLETDIIDLNGLNNSLTIKQEYLPPSHYLISLDFKDNIYPIIFNISNVMYNIEHGNFPKLCINDKKFEEFIKWIRQRFYELINIEISHNEYNKFPVPRNFDINHKYRGNMTFKYNIIKAVEGSDNKLNLQLVQFR